METVVTVLRIVVRVKDARTGMRPGRDVGLLDGTWGCVCYISNGCG